MCVCVCVCVWWGGGGVSVLVRLELEKFFYYGSKFKIKKIGGRGCRGGVGNRLSDFFTKDPNLKAKYIWGGGGGVKLE